MLSNASRKARWRLHTVLLMPNSNRIRIAMQKTTLFWGNGLNCNWRFFHLKGYSFLPRCKWGVRLDFEEIGGKGVHSQGSSEVEWWGFKHVIISLSVVSRLYRPRSQRKAGEKESAVIGIECVLLSKPREWWNYSAHCTLYASNSRYSPHYRFHL